MKDNKVGFAVIGMGIGKTHAKAILNTKDAELIALCDLNETRIQQRCKELSFTGDSYTDYREMLKDASIDVVSCCVPSGLHADVSMECARQGKHVLCEKPIDISLPRIDEMISTFEKAGVKLGCVFQKRNSPVFNRIKKTVREGHLGKRITANAYCKWYRTQQYYDDCWNSWKGTWKYDGGGALMNQSIHTIDLLNWIVGPVKAVTGQCRTLTHKMETEDTAIALLEFDDGGIGTIQGSTCIYPGLYTRLELHGEDGSIIVTDDTLNIWKLRRDEDGKEEEEMLALYGRNKDSTGASDPMAISSAGHKGHIEDMVKVAKENKDPMISPYEARHSVELILKIYESARTGKRVEL